MSNRYSDQPLNFRVKPDGPITTLPKPQHRKLARYLAEQRERNRDVLWWDVVSETGIQKWDSRMSEMRDLGFNILTISLPNPAKGDRRKLFRLSVDIEIIEGGGNGS